jgi:hypothetical protein
MVNIPGKAQRCRGGGHSAGAGGVMSAGSISTRDSFMLTL